MNHLEADLRLGRRLAKMPQEQTIFSNVELSNHQLTVDPNKLSMCISKCCNPAEDALRENAFCIEFSCRAPNLARNTEALKVVEDNGSFEAFSGDSTGAELWESSLTALLKLLIYEPIRERWVKGKNVLEVGCGIGLPGILCAASGSAFVLLTDCDHLALQICQRNIDKNRHVSNCCKSAVLTWSCSKNDLQSQFEKILQVNTVVQSKLNYPKQCIGSYDLCIGSDLIYTLSGAKKLAATIKIILEASAKKNKRCIGIIAHEIRFALSSIETRNGKRFVKEGYDSALAMFIQAVDRTDTAITSRNETCRIQSFTASNTSTEWLDTVAAYICSDNNAVVSLQGFTEDKEGDIRIILIDNISVIEHVKATTIF